MSDAKRFSGKGNKRLMCPDCGGKITAITGRNPKGTNVPIPNRRYCFKCDKLWKFTMTLE
jgi:hypothetical protein